MVGDLDGHVAEMVDELVVSLIQCLRWDEAGQLHARVQQLDGDADVDPGVLAVVAGVDEDSQVLRFLGVWFRGVGGGCGGVLAAVEGGDEAFGFVRFPNSWQRWWYLGICVLT